MKNLTKSTVLLGALFVLLLNSGLAQDKCVFDTLPPNETLGDYCTEALFLCGAVLDGYSSTLDIEPSGGNQPVPLCNQDEAIAQNITWISFIPCEEFVELEICASNCYNPNGGNDLGIQAGVYGDCDFNMLAACETEPQTGCFTLEFQADPYLPCIVFIDGYNNSVCDFEIHVISGIETEPFELEGEGELYVDGDEVPCAGGIGTYGIEGECTVSANSSCNGALEQTIEDLANQIICYEWTITPAIGWEIIGDHNGPTIDIQWNEPGTYQVSVAIVTNLDDNLIGCVTGQGCDILPLTVDVAPWTMNETYVELCEGDFYEFCGNTITVDGTYHCPDFQFCHDEVLHIIFIQPEPIFVDTLYICPGECAEYNGDLYCQHGSYVVDGLGICGEENMIAVIDLSVQLSVDGNSVIDCNNPIAELSGFYEIQDGTSTEEWLDGSGNIVSAGSNYSTDIPGSYTYRVIVELPNGFICVMSETIEVEELGEPIQIFGEAEELSCTVQESQIIITTNTNLVDYQWTGPSGFNSSEMNPVVTIPGSYILEYEDEFGCTGTFEIGIEKFDDFEEATVSFSDLSCANPEVIASFDSDQAIDFISWTGENLTSENGETVLITEPGMYTLELRMGDCIQFIFFQVLWKEDALQIDANGFISECNETEGFISVVGNELAEVLWQGPNGYMSTDATSTVFESGTYDVTVTDINGCTATESVEVLIKPGFTDLFVSFEEIDCNNPTTQLLVSSTNEIESFNWLSPNGNFLDELNPVVGEGGFYILEVVDANDCTMQEVIEVVSDFAIPNITFSTNDSWGCNSEEMEIGFYQNSNEDVTPVWSTSNGVILNQATDESLLAGSIGTYYLTLTSKINGCVNSDSFNIELPDNVPTAWTVEKQDLLCEEIHGNIEVLAVDGGVAPFTYSINGKKEQGDPLFDKLTSGSYMIKMVDANGCTLEDVVEIEGYSMFDGGIKGPSTGQFRDEISLQSYFDVDLSMISQINWYNSEGELLGSGSEVSFTLLKDEMITMEATNHDGCIIVRTGPINMDKDIKIYAPNVFSPNGDGLNEHFNLFSKVEGDLMFSLEIYDRWGNRMYADDELLLNDYNDGWNGTFNNAPVKSGVYTFIANIDDEGLQQKVKGSVTLIR